MKEMERIKPCKTFELVTPVPAGYEMSINGTTILAVDPKGIKGPLYSSFP
jgi:hypothetical protein